MKPTMAMRHSIDDFELLSASHLKGMALEQPFITAGERYPVWAEDPYYDEHRSRCQYVADTDWSVALVISTEVIERAKQRGYKRFPEDWTQQEVETEVRSYSSPPKTERAAISLIIEPIHISTSTQDNSFQNGNHRAIVLGSILPDALVPTLVNGVRRGLGTSHK
ncbi:hypothetical protein [Arthrobacter sp. ES3-54]|uniref:hypothetical protein n=1 Tax=Arthrobacter sp. ES3-54 TaxID=1502991 RepID=UPI002404C073|nr:hypothetical protein [Arthrobacter sp. ES3-54]MDF9750292.1 hypothetical protein [Arthrobacter sp. ES3-54]